MGVKLGLTLKKEHRLRVIKSRRMRWVRHEACMGAGEVHRGFWCEELRQNIHLEDLAAGGQLILKWIFQGL